MCQISIDSEHFQFWNQFGPKGGKYLIKIIFDIKIGTGVFQTPNVQNLSKFCALLILGPIWVKHVVSI